MPTINDFKEKKFKKVSHRPWDKIESIISTPNVDNITQAAENQNEPIPLSSKHSSVEEDRVIEVEPSLIDRWEYKDRQPNELGDISSLAKELKELGQQFPCVVRKKGSRYELIAGERRWRASILAGINLKITIRNFKNDEEAIICQFIENEKNPISDYSKGMHFAQAIKDGLIKQSILTGKLNISKQQVSRLLAFKDIPKNLTEAIGDFSKVTARTAAEIRILANKDPQNINALISVANKISAGIGSTTLVKEIRKYFSHEPIFNNTEKVLSSSGRHLFTWRKDGNGNVSVSFPKDIRVRLELKTLENELKNSILKQLNTLDL